MPMTSACRLFFTIALGRERRWSQKSSSLKLLKLQRQLHRLCRK